MNLHRQLSKGSRTALYFRGHQLGLRGGEAQVWLLDPRPSLRLLSGVDSSASANTCYLACLAPARDCLALWLLISPPPSCNGIITRMEELLLVRHPNRNKATSYCSLVGLVIGINSALTQPQLVVVNTLRCPESWVKLAVMI